MAGLMARALMTGEWSGALFLVGFAVAVRVADRRLCHAQPADRLHVRSSAREAAALILPDYSGLSCPPRSSAFRNSSICTGTFAVARFGSDQYFVCVKHSDWRPRSFFKLTSTTAGPKTGATGPEIKSPNATRKVGSWILVQRTAANGVAW